MEKKSILIIMDGWGEGNKTKADAIFNAKTPFTDNLKNTAAFAHLRTSGQDVGLPDGQMGNSEVGHLNIGAGRVVYQDLVRINKAVEEGTLATNAMITRAYNYALKYNKHVHFIGLVSDGGVHSSTSHLIKLCDIANDYGLKDVFVHVLTDGRDTDPKSGLGYVTDLQQHLSATNAKIASICGRYYTMDRDKRWERIREGYNLLVNGQGKPASDPLKAIEAEYASGITDEFIKPIVITKHDGTPITRISKDDVVICFNFRTDRLRQITHVLTQQNMEEEQMHTIPLQYYTMTRYDESFKNINIIFDKDDIKQTMGEVIANAHKKQIRIAETEKYAHVTFFFSGGRENEYEGEKRIMISSPKVATYDLQPEMSAPKVRDAIVAELKKGEADFICLNFANADMVGHTGNYEAIIKAVETVDQCVKNVTEAAQENGYSVMITADHGNADNAINSDGSINTAHSTNPVPLFLIDNDYHTLRDGRLCDIAPTLLKLMEIPIPKEMTGNVLI